MVNLKGAVISICVGIVVYFLFIRKVLMQKDANGNLVYVDRWPEWCNLEDKVYRPILLTVLPYVGWLLRPYRRKSDGGYHCIAAYLYLQ